MPRLTRRPGSRLFALAAGVSLVLCVGSVWLLATVSIPRLNLARVVWIEFADGKMVVQRPNGSGLLAVLSIPYHVLILGMLVLPLYWLNCRVSGHKWVFHRREHKASAPCAATTSAPPPTAAPSAAPRPTPTKDPLRDRRAALDFFVRRGLI